MVRGVLVAGLLVAMLGGSVRAADDEDRPVPAEFAPFDYLIGAWKGAGVPTANKVKGWDEKHMWAWKFVKGVPVGLSMELEGDKTLKKGLLTYDADKKHYLLEGTDPAGKPLTFAGNFDKTGKKLILEFVGKSDEPKEQITLFPNGDRIRYTIWVNQKEAGSPQFKRVYEIGVTKEGESFAAGADVANVMKCILTGGNATMSVSYQGKSYPVCCTGCRDEFNDNPEKYVKRAALREAQGGGKTPVKAASARAGKDDGSFDGFGDEPKKEMPKKKAAPSTKAKPKDDMPADSDDVKPAAKADDKLAAKAASALRIGQNLEKSGKTAAALKSYQDVVKSYPDTPAAKTAAERVKALGGR